ncbi:hypothetical protein F3Y22_tig00014862pilonHSYRG00090 [Hibiscus syriacus]|uniref:Protein FAR1-RELATED SEQUENCE n=1 Tax=Hibiscus syriacus TaxID=106335 RepID=A0A6A3C1K4_HIBSY|nr:hypothetical protein F3Y22_tig00014862pilonHSYRG00090 [Hibiscus syriacus]
MDHTDADNVKPTDECHEVHNVDESDILVGKLFSSRDQAWYFYKGFAREHGFSARKGTTRLDVEGNVKTQEFCCSKEGFRVSKVNIIDRQRAHTPVTRTGCKADIDEATTLKEVGVGTSQVMNYLTQQAEGAIIMLDLHINTSTMHFKERAIKYVIPNAKHKLCSWHLSRNAQANIGDPKFTAAFSKCMASWWKTDEFDIQWCLVVSEFNVEKHPWVIEKGNTWHLWAQAYLTSHFFANIRSTQRCESMNASLAIVLKHKKTYLDVVRAIEDRISRMRLNELKADYLSSQTKPFHITKLVEFESHASEIFTRKSFHAFQEELQRETLYRVQEEIQSLSDECQYFYLKKYKEKNRTFEISFDSRTKTLNCSCKKFETVGHPSRHQLHVLKHLDYTYLPGSLIQSRWTKDAKASAPSFVDLNVPQEIMQMARFASLCATASLLCYAASKTDASFKTARDEMKRLTEEFENSFGLNDSVNRSSVLNNVRDPQQKQRKQKEVTKNKVKKKIRRCGFCNGEGHNKLTCPQVKLGLNTSTQSTSTDFFEDGME